MTSSSIKSHEEHHSLVSASVSEIHSELDKILKVVVEDRSYGGARKDHSGSGHSVDLPHIRRLFDALMGSMTVLQVDAHEIAVAVSGAKKKINKALVSAPCGYLNVEEVSSVALRLLRVNSTSSPKQVRADKRSYDDLIQVHLPDLHVLAWKVVSFLLINVETGTEVFERELGTLARDQIKNDLKMAENSGIKKLVGKGSERALELFCHLTKTSTSFNGQVFVNEFVRSCVLVELSSKASKQFASLLRRGLTGENEQLGSNNKRARYHQASESDQKRLENAQAAFSSELQGSFSILCRSFAVFESSQSHLTPHDHVQISETILFSIATLLQCQHNFKFIPEIVEGEYLRFLIQILSGALVSFQPAYLPPFIPLAMRLLNLLAGRFDGAGCAARRALLQVDLMIHPRRLGPVVYRQPTEAVLKVFERSEPVVEIVSVVEQLTVAEPVKEPVTVIGPVVQVPVALKEVVSVAPILASVVKPVAKTAPTVTAKPIAPVPVPVPQKRTITTTESTDEDDDLPHIVDCGPDDI